MEQVMKAYAARAYTKDNPRTSNYVDVNVPNYTPTLAKDASKTKTTVSGNYFVNSNYPITQGTAVSVNYLSLPLLSGTTCPTIFSKGTPFVLLCPTQKIEEGYLILI